MLSSNSGCTLRVQFYRDLSPERLGFHQLWSDKQQNLPSAHQLHCMLAPFSTSSASLTPCPLPLPIQKRCANAGYWEQHCESIIEGAQFNAWEKRKGLGSARAPTYSRSLGQVYYPRDCPARQQARRWQSRRPQAAIFFFNLKVFIKE